MLLPLRPLESIKSIRSTLRQWPDLSTSHARLVLQVAGDGRRLQLDYIKAKAMAFVKRECAAGRGQFLFAKDALNRLQSSALTEIIVAVLQVSLLHGPEFHCSECGSLFAMTGPASDRAVCGRPVLYCPACCSADVNTVLRGGNTLH